MLSHEKKQIDNFNYLKAVGSKNYHLQQFRYTVYLYLDYYLHFQFLAFLLYSAIPYAPQPHKIPGRGMSSV